MKLIINADDAGVDAARNRGIFEAIENGVVTSISVIVYQTGWADILDRLAKNKDIGAGLHVNLTSGRPLVEGHRTLVNERGFFFDKFELFTRACAGTIDPQEVSAEFTAQFEKLKDSGITPTHIDGHNHVHILPGVREGFKEFAPKDMWVRLPIEHQNEPLDAKGVDLRAIYDNTEELVSVFNFLAQEAKNIWQDKFRYADDFAGTKLTPHPTVAGFKRAIKALKGEICELMVHPGAPAGEEAGWFSKLKERQKELKILTSQELKLFLKKQNIELVSFRAACPIP